MSSLSLALIVKNEEKVLKNCLDSFKNLVDEIIIVDTGSTDKTKEIAKEYTNNIYDFKWEDDFSKARNYCFSLCTCEYIMWVDADDIFEKSQNNAFIKLKNNLHKYDVIMMKYNLSFNEQQKPTFSFFRERIVKNNKTFFWQDAVHEYIVPHGKVYYSNLFINHKPIEKEQSDRNLKIYEKIIQSGKVLNTRQKYYYSRELMFNKKFLEAVASFEEYLKSDNIWKENRISACRDLANCYLELKQNKNAKKALFDSFLFDAPRGEVCCSIGNIFFQEKEYNIAIFWYEMALKCKPDFKSGAFVEIEYYNIIPFLQLCVCYYNLGDIKNAIKFNNKVGKIAPQNSSYLLNKKFFENIK